MKARRLLPRGSRPGLGLARVILALIAAVGAAYGFAAAALNGPPERSPVFTHPRLINHPYLPLGSLPEDILEGKESGHTVRVERRALPGSHKHFRIGQQTVDTLAIEDREFKNGALDEVSVDFFAQADDGTVFYLGESVDEYRDGNVVGHEGAWLYGIDTQIPGVLLPAMPKVGAVFISEDVPKISREIDEVVSLSADVTTPAGHYTGCLEIKERTSDGTVEHKYYAKGIGCVKEETRKGSLNLKSHTTTNTAPQSPQNTGASGSGDPPAQDELARIALALVGMEPAAEQYWIAAINDKSLSADERQNLIEDLNEDGLSDPENPTLADLPLIVGRLELIEDLAPYAMDQVNRDAFREAYKDLIDMYERLTRP